MSHKRPTVAIPAQRARLFPDGAAVPRPRRPLRGAAPGNSVIRIDLGMSEWALALTPTPAGQSPGGLAGALARPVTSRLGLVRVPGLPDPRLGPAVLHYRHGRTVIYCAAGQITDLVAWALSALAEQVMCEIAQPGSRIAVTPAAHSDLLLAGMHPAKVVIADDNVTFNVCSDLIEGELARALGLLWSAQAAYLPRSRVRGPRTQCPGPAGARS